MYSTMDGKDIFTKIDKSKPRQKKKINLPLRRAIIEEVMGTGRFCTIEFNKANGDYRVLNCKRKRVPEEERKAKAKSNPEVITVWEVNKQQYRSIRLDSIVKIKGQGEEIRF